MNGDAMIRRSDLISAVDVDGESVILNIESGEYYGMKDVSTFVWSLLEEPKRFGEICDAVLSAYEVDRATVEADIAELVDAMQAKGLVKVGE